MLLVLARVLRVGGSYDRALVVAERGLRIRRLFPGQKLKAELPMEKSMALEGMERLEEGFSVLGQQ
ncbi:MAG: hypothetical protein SA339_03115 [Methanomassiliicoccus sp.]|nr:hypothetical protein [Methanomassiliicoccus sp.]